MNDEHFDFRYTPESNFGAKNPKHIGEECVGRDLSETPYLDQVDLQWLIEAYRNSTAQSKVFNTKNFTRHAGTDLLQKQSVKGMDAESIRKSWEKDLKAFREIRVKYLIYD